MKAAANLLKGCGCILILLPITIILVWVVISLILSLF